MRTFSPRAPTHLRDPSFDQRENPEPLPRTDDTHADHYRVAFGIPRGFGRGYPDVEGLTVFVVQPVLGEQQAGPRRRAHHARDRARPSGRRPVS